MINKDEYFNNIRTEQGELLKGYTLKLFIWDNTKIPNPLASAVLIKTNQNHYLLTAVQVKI